MAGACRYSAGYDTEKSFRRQGTRIWIFGIFGAGLTDERPLQLSAKVEYGTFSKESRLTSSVWMAWFHPFSKNGPTIDVQRHRGFPSAALRANGFSSGRPGRALSYPPTRPT